MNWAAWKHKPQRRNRKGSPAKGHWVAEWQNAVAIQVNTEADMTQVTPYTEKTENSKDTGETGLYMSTLTQYAYRMLWSSPDYPARVNTEQDAWLLKDRIYRRTGLLELLEHT